MAPEQHNSSSNTFPSQLPTIPAEQFTPLSSDVSLLAGQNLPNCLSRVACCLPRISRRTILNGAARATTVALVGAGTFG